MADPEGLFEPVLISDEIARITSAYNWTQKMVEVEGALAIAEGELGIIPSDAANQIASLVRTHGLNPTELGMGARLSGTPVIPLVRMLTDRLTEGARPWIHYGATSQDILDTATILVTREALSSIFSDLVKVGDTLANLADEHRNTPMVARTLLQHAVPMTFGLKAANWLEGVISGSISLANLYQNTLAVQFGGAGGTLASLGERGVEVGRKVAEILQLKLPIMPWHSQRIRISELSGAMTLVIGSLAKIATDVTLGSQAEIGEISESLGSGGGSSAMPQKVNPVGSIVVNACFRRALGLLPVLYGCMIAENERGAGEWQAEWQSYRDLLQLTGGAVNRSSVILTNLVINEQKMKANLSLSKGNVLSERVMLRLSEVLGRSVAHDLVRDATQRSSANQTFLADELAKNTLFTDSFSPGEITELFDPMTYLGSTQVFIDAVLSQWRQIRPQWQEAARGIQNELRN